VVGFDGTTNENGSDADSASGLAACNCSTTTESELNASRVLDADEVDSSSRGVAESAHAADIATTETKKLMRE
jgi:hypothetical protein